MREKAADAAEARRCRTEGIAQKAAVCRRPWEKDGWTAGGTTEKTCAGRKRDSGRALVAEALSEVRPAWSHE